MSIFDIINNLLYTANLTVRLQADHSDDILVYHVKNENFSMAKLSDEERNAIVLAAAVLTVDPGTVLLIDEPERHLHRSIIEPFLTALFESRPGLPVHHLDA
jgi:AAA15 family ATPase/GTPase